MLSCNGGRAEGESYNLINSRIITNFFHFLLQLNVKIGVQTVQGFTRSMKLSIMKIHAYLHRHTATFTAGNTATVSIQSLTIDLKPSYLGGKGGVAVQRSPFTTVVRVRFLAGATWELSLFDVLFSPLPRGFFSPVFLFSAKINM